GHSTPSREALEDSMVLAVRLAVMATLGVLGLWFGSTETRADPARAIGGFIDHGIAAPVARARGVVATHDGDGRPVLLMWLRDEANLSILMVDAETGESRVYPVP